jgi:hypothetical protein
MELVISATDTAKTPPTWSAGEVEFDVLRTFWAGRSALTKRQLQVRTGVSAEDISEAVARLCASGRLNRLNTLVESYALPAWSAIRPVAGPVVGAPSIANV